MSDGQSTRLFYGWVVVACAFSILALAYGVQYSFGVYVPAIVDDLGWERATLGGAFSLYAMIYLGVTVLAGRLTDKLGPRLVISVGGLLIAAGLLGSSRATEPWHLFFWYGIVAAFGMSTAYIPCNITVARWFERRRGLAVGLSSSGSSCGIFLVPLLAVTLLTQFGWRSAMAGLATLLFFLTLIAARFMVRSPADAGLLPDGEQHDRETPTRALPASMNLRTSLKTSSLWIFIFGFAVALVPMTVPFVHLSVLATDLELAVEKGAIAVSVIGITALIGGICLGILSDRIGLKVTFLLALFSQVVAYTLFYFAQSEALVLAGAVFFGVFYGGFSATFPGLMVHLFGPANAGTIGGLVISGGGLLGSWGPAAVGYFRDSDGDYKRAFLFCAAMALGSVVLMTFLKKPAMEEHA